MAAAVNGLEAVGAPLLGVALTGTPPSRLAPPPCRFVPRAGPGPAVARDGRCRAAVATSTVLCPGPRPATRSAPPRGSIPTGGAPNGSVTNGAPHNGAPNGTPTNGIPNGTASPTPGRGEGVPHGASEQRLARARVARAAAGTNPSERKRRWQV